MTRHDYNEPMVPRTRPKGRKWVQTFSGRSIGAAPRLVLLVLPLLLVGCSGGGWGRLSRERRGVDAERLESGAVPATLERLEVENRFGDLRVVVSEGGVAPGWEWRLTCWGDTLSEAEMLVKEIKLEARPDEEGIALALRLVVPESPPAALRGIESDLTVRVPPGTRVTAENRFGPSTFEGTRGGLLARCGHGSVDVREVRGELDVTNEFGSLSASGIDGGTVANRHGSVRVEDAGGDLSVSGSFGAIDVRRVSGGLVVRNEHAGVEAEEVRGAVDIETSFGRIVVEGAPLGAQLRNRHGSIEARGLAGSVDARTTFDSLTLAGDPREVDCENEHGAVNIALGEAPCRVKARTSFGSLEVETPRDVTVRVEAEATFGSIDSELESGAVARDGNTQRLAGGDAAAPIQLDLAAEHGSVRLKRRS